jgi:diketogulonate reductase-like aldo/keto reductase
VDTAAVYRNEADVGAAIPGQRARPQFDLGHHEACER